MGNDFDGIMSVFFYQFGSFSGDGEHTTTICLLNTFNLKNMLEIWGETLHIYHAYIGVFLIVWSVAVIGFKALMIGEYNPWLAIGGLLLGIVLLVHDVLWHLRHRKNR